MPAPRYLRLNDATKKKEEGLGIQSSSGVADGGKLISTDDDGFLDPSFLRDGEVLIREASEDLDAGDFVNVFDDGGVAKARKAEASGPSTKAVGYITNNFLDGEQATILGEGILSGQTGLTIGEPVFLSLTAGDITQTPPTGVGEIWQQVGVAISATEVRVEIGEPICRN